MARKKEIHSIRSYKERNKEIKELENYHKQNLLSADYTQEKQAQVLTEIQKLKDLQAETEVYLKPQVSQEPEPVQVDQELLTNTEENEDIVNILSEPPKVVQAPIFSFQKLEETPENEPKTAQNEPEKEHIEIEIPAELQEQIQAEKEKVTTPQAQIPTVETKEVAADKVKLSMPSEWSAKHIIEIGDKITTIVSRHLYDSVLITPQERAFIKVATKYQKTKESQNAKEGKNETVYIEIPPEFDGVFRKIEEIEQLKEKLPFTKEEKESLLLPLEMYLRDTGIELTPGKALITVVGIIMLPRFMPLASHYLEKAMTKQAEVQEKVFESYFNQNS